MIRLGLAWFNSSRSLRLQTNILNHASPFPWVPANESVFISSIVEKISLFNVGLKFCTGRFLFLQWKVQIFWIVLHRKILVSTLKSWNSFHLPKLNGVTLGRWHTYWLMKDRSTGSRWHRKSIVKLLSHFLKIVKSFQLIVQWSSLLTISHESSFPIICF